MLPCLSSIHLTDFSLNIVSYKQHTPIALNIFDCLSSVHNSKFITSWTCTLCTFNESTFRKTLLPLSGNLNDHVAHIYRKYADLTESKELADQFDKKFYNKLITLIRLSSFTKIKVMILREFHKLKIYQCQIDIQLIDNSYFRKQVGNFVHVIKVL